MSSKDDNSNEAYDKEYDAFIKQLDEFHQQKGLVQHPTMFLPRTIYVVHVEL